MGKLWTCAFGLLGLHMLLSVRQIPGVVTPCWRRPEVLLVAGPRAFLSVRLRRSPLAYREFLVSPRVTQNDPPSSSSSWSLLSPRNEICHSTHPLKSDIPLRKLPNLFCATCAFS